MDNCVRSCLSSIRQNLEDKATSSPTAINTDTVFAAANSANTNTNTKTNTKTNSETKINRLAVIGIDILLAEIGGKEVFKAFLLEVNNNPALPQPDKHKMSESYRALNVSLCRDMALLGLEGGLEEGEREGGLHNFVKLEC